MREALLHPDYGYYTTRALRVAGDFITAPEISQIFGEVMPLVCCCLAAIRQSAHRRADRVWSWRGTLMADILRAIVPASASY